MEITHTQKHSLVAGPVVAENTGLTVTAAGTYARGLILERAPSARYKPFNEAPSYDGVVKTSQTLGLGAGAVHPVGTILAHDGTKWILYVPGADGDPDPVAAATPRGVLLTATTVAGGTSQTVDVFVAGTVDADILDVAGAGSYGASDELALRDTGIVPVTAVSAPQRAIAVLADDVVATGAGTIACTVYIAGSHLRKDQLALASEEAIPQSVLDALQTAGIIAVPITETRLLDNDNG